MRTTLVQDHIAQRGGAERVLLSMAAALGSPPVLTSVYNPAATYEEISELDIRPMWFSRLQPLQTNHRWAFPIMAQSFSSLRPTTPITLCASAGWSHGVKARGAKVVYWYAPARWLYQRAEYVGDRGLGALAVSALSPTLRRWDRKAVSTVDRHIAISTAVAVRLRSIYGVTAEVLHPPVTLDANPEPVPGIEPGYLVMVSRLMSYKNVDVVLQAMSQLPDHRLVIAGVGPHSQVLMSMAPTNVKFVGSVTDAQLAWLYTNSLALVSAAHEDFGLTPLEAARYGRPTLALRAGGFLDTIEESLTGAFFPTLDPADIVAGVEKMGNQTWDSNVLRSHAAGFSRDRFSGRLNEILAEVSRQL